MLVSIWHKNIDYIVASLSTELPNDNPFIPVICCTQDDLPPHIKGSTVWLWAGISGKGYYCCIWHTRPSQLERYIRIRFCCTCSQRCKTSIFLNSAFLALRIHSQTKRGQTPLHIHGRPLSVHAQWRPLFRLLSKIFSHFFVSICVFFFACMPLKNVATMYKNQPVSLKNIIEFCSFPSCTLSTPSRTLTLLLLFTHVLSPFRF